MERLTGMVIQTTPVAYHRFLLGSVASGWCVSRFKATAKWMTAQATGVTTDVLAAEWTVSLSQGLHGGTEPPLPSAGPTDSSIMAFDLAEPVGLERIFWAPSSSEMNIVTSFTASIEWRGQMHLAAETDFYFMMDNNAAGSLDFTISIGWSIWSA